MAELNIYATSLDVELLRTWINEDPGVAWIVKANEENGIYTWQAKTKISVLAEQDYAIWHIRSGPLNIPSGSKDKADILVPDPFSGWQQARGHSGATRPWFGANLPGPYNFRFREAGKEAPTSIGRSGFSWALDRFKSIGKPAPPDAIRWWLRLKRHVTANATEIRWPDPKNSRSKAFVFADALKQAEAGRHRDINP
jgi:hypothetical protein